MQLHCMNYGMWPQTSLIAFAVCNATLSSIGMPAAQICVFDVDCSLKCQNAQSRSTYTRCGLNAMRGMSSIKKIVKALRSEASPRQKALAVSCVSSRFRLDELSCVKLRS